MSSWPLGRVFIAALALVFCLVGLVASLGVDVIVGAASVLLGTVLLLVAVRLALGGDRRKRR